MSVAATRLPPACTQFFLWPVLRWNLRARITSHCTFNLAGLIADTGSPDNALRKARSLVAHINANGGCPQSEELAVCEEILAVTRKAIVALEACSSSGVPSVKMPENERTASK